MSTVVLKALMPAYGGYTIAREDRVIFIKGAVPGEVVDVDIEEKKRDYSVARVRSILEPSEHRTDPPCPVFGVCGGCHLQYAVYEKQLLMKDEIIADTLKRLGGIETPPLGPPLAGRQWGYRHRAQFKVSKAGEVGFFRESSREVVTFSRCPLLREEINLLFGRIRERGLGAGLSHIHIALGDAAIALLKGNEAGADLVEGFMEAGFSGVAVNDAPAAGEAFTTFDLNGLRYTVSPWTFFQAHWELNRLVAKHLADELSPLDGKRILDLYAGAGNFSLPLAAGAAEVIAVEENPKAVEDGERNVSLSGLKNFRFIRSSAERYRIHKKCDILLLDPPRPGLTSAVVGKVLDALPERIVYISCNPSTLARDLKKLKEKYRIESVRQVDFFPNTFHIETIAFLRVL